MVTRTLWKMSPIQEKGRIKNESPKVFSGLSVFEFMPLDRSVWDHTNYSHWANKRRPTEDKSIFLGGKIGCHLKIEKRQTFYIEFLIFGCNALEMQVTF